METHHYTNRSPEISPTFPVPLAGLLVLADVTRTLQTGWSRKADVRKSDLVLMNAEQTGLLQMSSSGANVSVFTSVYGAGSETPSVKIVQFPLLLY